MNRNLNEKVQNGLEKLNGLLPLKDRQRSLDEKSKTLHRAFLKTLAESGRAMTKEEMRDLLKASDQEIDDITNKLKELDLLVVDCCGGPVGSYPMTTESTEHIVNSDGVRVNAMCALDSLGVSLMFNRDSVIDSKCRVTGEPIRIEQNGYDIKKAEPSPDIHFGIDWNSKTDGCCAAESLCMEMVFLKDGTTAEKWMKDKSDSREIYTLAESVDFSGAFFTPLMQD